MTLGIGNIGLGCASLPFADGPPPVVAARAGVRERAFLRVRLPFGVGVVSALASVFRDRLFHLSLGVRPFYRLVLPPPAAQEWGAHQHCFIIVPVC